MVVEAKHHKHFVARQLSDEFGGVVVSFPIRGVTSNRVNLKGERNLVDAAKARILQIVQNLEEEVTIDCEKYQQLNRYGNPFYRYFYARFNFFFCCMLKNYL